MKVSGIDASYYGVEDLDRATNFYTALFGAKPTVQHPEVLSEWTLPDGASFGLYKGTTFKPSDGVMFSVDDVPAAMETLKSLGVTIHDQLEDTPVCKMAFGNDSEGNGFILHKRK